MTIATTIMGLLKGQDTDNARTYIATSLAAALDRIDGHVHAGTTSGSPIGVAGLDLTTWGPVARSQGLIIAPQGSVTDDGAGNLTIGSGLIVINPASGSNFFVNSGVYALGADSALVCDLPPTTGDSVTVTPTVLAWAHNQRAYDGKDRLVLAYRYFTGAIWCRFAVPAALPLRFNVQTLGAPAATLVTPTLPGGYSAIVITGQLRSDYGGGGTNAPDKIGVRFNADSTAGHYSGAYAYNDNTTTPKADPTSNAAQAIIGQCACSGTLWGGYGSFALEIPSYANGSYNKNFHAHGSAGVYGTVANVAVAYHGAGQWNQTAAITTVTLFPVLGSNWLAGSMWTVTLVP